MPTLTDVVAGWFPVPGIVTTCGNRLDLPRKQRVHWWVCLGYDVQNKGTEGIVEVLVYACWACGKDKRV